VKRNETKEPKQPAFDGKTADLVRKREMVAVVKSWIDEFKFRSRQEALVKLSLLDKA